MEFIETSHACPDILGVGGWKAQTFLLKYFKFSLLFNIQLSFWSGDRDITKYKYSYNDNLPTLA